MGTAYGSPEARKRAVWKANPEAVRRNSISMSGTEAQEDRIHG